MTKTLIRFSAVVASLLASVYPLPWQTIQAKASQVTSGMLNQPKALMSISLDGSNQAASDGTMDRGNPQRTGVYKTKGLHQLSSVLWKSSKLFDTLITKRDGRLRIIDLPVGAGLGVGAALIYQEEDSYSEYYSDIPFVFNTMVYFTLYTGHAHLAALDAKTGTMKWHFKRDLTVFSYPAIADDTVYFGGSDGNFYALDCKTGQEQWRFTKKGTAFSLSSPILLNGIAYFGSSDGSLYALDTKTRQPNWVFKAKSFLRTPAFADETIYVTSGEGYLYAVDMKTGQEKWKLKLRARSPILANGLIYCDDREAMYAIDSRTGTLKWKRSPAGKLGTSLAFADGMICFGGWRDSMYAMDAETGLEKWKFKTSGPVDSPVIADGVVYFGSVGTLYAVDAKTGQQKFTIDAPKASLSSPAIANGVIYFVRDDGHLYAIH